MAGVQMVSARGAKITVSEESVPAMVLAGFRRTEPAKKPEKQTAKKSS